MRRVIEVFEVLALKCSHLLSQQILTAEVVDNGNGTLTATYEALFPGDYLVYVDEVTPPNRDEGKPIVNSPFSVTVTGTPKLQVDDLPVCGSTEEDLYDRFWRPGTWVSSNVASQFHGVTRHGWMFQPRTCALDAFSYDDLMHLASSEEPSWLLVLGGSVQRGVFLTLVDMVLAEGQKDDLIRSAIGKCWGYGEVRVGNLRVTYQVREALFDGSLSCKRMKHNSVPRSRI